MRSQIGALLIGAITIVCGLVQPARAAEKDVARVNELLATARLPITLQSQQLDQKLAKNLGGEGGAWLEQQIRQSHIFMVGEEHGLADAPQLLEHLLPTLTPAGYRAYAVEVGPHLSAAMETMWQRNDGSFAHYTADWRNALNIPFLNTKEDAAFADAAIQSWKGKGRVLWGLDQELVTSAPFLIDQLARHATTPPQKALVARHRAGAQTDVQYLGKMEPAMFDELDAAFAKVPAAKATLKDMAISARIYAPYVRKVGAFYPANDERENYMKDNFLAQWQAAKTRAGQAPKVVMKFGNNHLAAGLSATRVLSLGTFVRDLARIEKIQTTAVAVICGPGGKARTFTGATDNCDESFDKTYKVLRPYLFKDGYTLIPTASLRTIGGTMERAGLPEDFRTQIFAYDALLVFTGAQPTTPITPPDPKVFEGFK